MSDTIRSEVSKSEPSQSRRAHRKARRLERERGPQEPDTCPQCGRAVDDSSTEVLLLGGKLGHFCSPGCIVAFARSEEGAAQILWRPFFKASKKIILHYSQAQCCCIQCGRNEGITWGDEADADADVKAIKHARDEAEQDAFCRIPVGRTRVEAFNAWHKLRWQLLEILGARMPAYRIAFMEISGGFDSLVDGVYLLCSVKCLIEFVEERSDTPES
jgi:YHS domain-containing protein